jgi:hypothetical protein
MSADNGFVLRKNVAGQFVVQMYFASADEYPPINDPKANVFNTLEEALMWYELYAGYSEYGLTARIKHATHNPIV